LVSISPLLACPLVLSHSAGRSRQALAFAASILTAAQILMDIGISNVSQPH
jgi:hypothetical protein